MQLSETQTIIEVIADLVEDVESAQTEAAENDGMIQRWVPLATVLAAQKIVNEK